MEIIQRVWPDEAPFTTDRHDILRGRSKRVQPGSAVPRLAYRCLPSKPVLWNAVSLEQV